MKLCQRQLQRLSQPRELVFSLVSKRQFAQMKKTRKTMSPEEVRKAQMQRDQSGLLELAMKAEEEFYQTEGTIDLQQIQKDGEQISKDLNTEQLRKDIMTQTEDDNDNDLDEITSTYSPLTAQYNSVLDYDAHTG